MEYSMARHVRTFIHVCVCVVLLMSHLVGTAAAQSSDVEGRYIVLLRSDTKDPAATAAELGRRVNATLKVDRVFTSAIKGFAGRFPTKLVSALAHDPNVVSIDVDQLVSATAQTLPTGVDRIDADRSATAAIDGIDTRLSVDVAVLDTGVGPHPDLNVVGGKDCTNTGSYADNNGHGTHVAGIIGALDDGNGVVGVAPGVRIWSVKVLDRFGNGSWSNIICGIDWVTANKTTISVANMSLSGSGTAGTSCASSSLRQAICNSVSAGVTYVAAAGNNTKNVNTFVPAAFPEVIAVSALADFNGVAGGGAASAPASPSPHPVIASSRRGSTMATTRCPGQAWRHRT
jgi:subtilisin